MDRLSKSTHFLPVRDGMSTDQLGRLYVREIVRLHGVPRAIVSDRDSRFLSAFWKSLQRALGTRLHFSSAYHPQSDGQTERVNQILEDMLRACCLDFQTSWVDLLPLMEFTYNNSYQSTIQMAPFEALYGRKCRSPLYWDEIGERDSVSAAVGPEMTQQMIEQIRVIRQRIKQAQDRQKSYANVRRKELEFEVGDFVFLKVAPYRHVLRFGKKGKLAPRFIGPYEILERVGPVAYRLVLPASMDRFHDVFHVSQLRKYIRDPSHVLELPELELAEDLSYQEMPVQIIDRRVKVLRNKEIPLVRVLWRNQRQEESEWKVESEIRDRFPELFR